MEPRLLSFLNRSQFKDRANCVRLIVVSLVHSSWTLISNRRGAAWRRREIQRGTESESETKGRGGKKERKQDGKTESRWVSIGSSLYTCTPDFLSERSAAGRARIFSSSTRNETCFHLLPHLHLFFFIVKDNTGVWRVSQSPHYLPGEEVTRFAHKALAIFYFRRLYRPRLLTV